MNYGETPSAEAYKILTEGETIRNRQKIALRTIHKFHDEVGFWPTQREAHVFLVEESSVLTEAQRAEAITDGYRFIRRRMGELVVSADNDHPDVLEKLDRREHTYLIENYPGADSGRRAEPHRPKKFGPDNDVSTSTLPFQSTLASFQ